MNEESHNFYKITANGKQVGKYGLSFYQDIKAVGIGSFEIFPEHRRKGYAETAIRKIVSKYKDKCDLIYCFVDADNVPAIALYKKIGKVSDEVNDNGQHYVEFYRNR